VAVHDVDVQPVGDRCHLAHRLGQIAEVGREHRGGDLQRAGVAGTAPGPEPAPLAISLIWRSHALEPRAGGRVLRRTTGPGPREVHVEVPIARESEADAGPSTLPPGRGRDGPDRVAGKG